MCNFSRLGELYRNVHSQNWWPMKWLLFALSTLSVLFSEEKIHISLSSAEEICDRSHAQNSSYLIDGVLSPLTGQLSLHQIDLIAQGAEPISLHRVYIPPTLPSPIASSSDQWSAFHEQQAHYAALSQQYRGWVLFPHCFCQIFGSEIRIVDPNGASLDFRIDGSKATLHTTSFGMSNAIDEHCHASYDLRNTSLRLESNRIIVVAPDATQRIYERVSPITFRLAKEVLPNGKVIRYSYKDLWTLVRIESLDPKERHIYATLDIEGSLLMSEQLACKANSGDTAVYLAYRPKRADKIKQPKQHREASYLLTFPPVLTRVNSPSYRKETIGYESDFALNSFVSKNEIFQCSYAPFNRSLRINTLARPVEENDTFQSLYTISYDPPIAGQKNGFTTATRCDGTKVHFAFSKSLLLESVNWFDERSTLAKEKKFHWDEQQRLAQVDCLFGNGTPLYRKTYTFDRFGNPETETLTAPTQEPQVTRRKYSDDGRHLLLREEESNGKVTLYHYLPETNLKTAKYTCDKTHVLITESWKYDDSHNLVEYALDDGLSSKRITRYHLREQAPFLHMPEWIEELANEQLLRKTHLSYDFRGHIAKKQIYDANNVFAYALNYEYDEQGNLLKETNPLGQTKSTCYDSHGRPTEMLNFSNRLQTTYSYDLQGRLRTRSEGAHVAHYSYDALDRCIETIDYLKNKTTYIRDPLTGEVLQAQGPPVDYTALYDPFGRKISSTDANGNTTTFQYNLYGKPTQITHPDKTHETFRYTSDGELKSKTNAEGFTILYEHDVLNRVTQKRFFSKELLASETFTYTPLHLQSHQDKEGHITYYTHDAAGRLAEQTVEGRRTTFQYDSLGRLSAINYSNLLTIHYERDLLDRILIEDKNTSLWQKHYTYDADGNRASVTVPGVETTTFAYDPFGRQLSETDALGNTTTTTYDETGPNLRKIITDPSGIPTYITYDPYQREISKQIGSHPPITQRYDSAGNLIEIQEAPRTVCYSYDSRNRIRSLTRASKTSDERRIAYTYTPMGKPATKTLPDHRILNYTYTPFGDLASLTASDGSLQQHFQYTKNGHLRSASDGSCTLQRTLDAFGNIIQETTAKQTLCKEYDALDRLTLLTLPDHTQIAYTYNGPYLQAVTRRSATGAPLYTHTYDTHNLAGDPLQETRLDGQTLQRTYDPCGRITTIATPHFTQSIDYDPNSRIQALSNDGAYAYDDLSQLVKEPAHAYAYDTHHNRIQTDAKSAHYNLLDELIAPDILYDPCGNLIAQGDKRYQYDALNRLISVNQTRFSYDALGRVALKLSPESNEFYMYTQGTEELGAWDSNGTLKALKVPAFQGHPIAIELNSKVYLPILDYRGNVRKLVDPATSQVARAYNYTAFGEALSEDAATLDANPWRYSAKRFDSALGLYYFGKRFYDPTISRWLSVDPAGFIDGTNLYAYLLNNPLNAIDPEGTSAIAIPFVTWAIGGTAWCPITWGIVAAVAVGYAAHWGVQKMIESGAFNKQHSQAWKASSTEGATVIAQPAADSKKKKPQETYAPDRPLPRDKDGIPIPDTDASHTQLGTREGSKGPYPQAREFDNDAKTIRDIDFTDHGRPDKHPKPHQHRYIENETGGTPKRSDMPEKVPEWRYR